MSHGHVFSAVKLTKIYVQYICVNYRLKWKVSDRDDYSDDEAPNDTTYKRWRCHCGYKPWCKLCRNLPPPAMGDRFTVFWASRPCRPAGWLALLVIKAGDVETNPCLATTHNHVCICDICHKQIRSRYR